MRTIEELKKAFILGELDLGLYTSTNENGLNCIVEIRKDGFSIKTYQENGWIRENEFILDEGNTWIESEIYSK